MTPVWQEVKHHEALLAQCVRRLKCHSCTPPHIRARLEAEKKQLEQKLENLRQQLVGK